MATPRFHLPLTLAPGGRVALPDDIAHHALRVLRLRDGDDIIVFNGDHGQFRATLSVQTRDLALALISTPEPCLTEPAGRITLVQGLPSGDKMDWIVEKAVELGVHAIVPIAADRSVLRLSGERLEKRVRHWQRVAQAACEQSGRIRIPQVSAPVSLATWLQAPVGRPLLCHPHATQGLTPYLRSQPGLDALSLLIGPEGGWSDEELAQATRAGVDTVRFGARVLRTETAGLALLAAVGTTLGWYED